MPLNVVIVGCGRVARGHVPGWRAAGVEVALCVDTDKDRGAEFASRLDVPEWSTDTNAALNREDIDIVDICLPHHLHAPIAIQALNAGKHVLVEKPMSTTVLEAQEMNDAADRNQRLLMVRHNHRFFPVRSRMKRLIDEGAIGSPYLLRSACFQGPEYFYDRPWYGKKSEGRGGVLLGNGIHHLDLFRWYGGEVKQVSALTQNSHLKRVGMDAEDTSVFICEFESGALGELVFTNADTTNKYELELIEVHGSDGWLSSSAKYGHLGVSRQAFGDGEVHEIAGTPDQESEFAHFRDCVSTGKTPLTNGVEAAKSVELAVAAYRSAETGKVVTLPIDPDEVYGRGSRL